MKKLVQLEINKEVMNAIERLNEECKLHPLGKGKRLRTCKAYVFETPNFYLLRSYDTYVAAIEKDTDICYDFLRFVYGYTITSAQHISKFVKDYGCGMWGCKERLTYREV